MDVSGLSREKFMAQKRPLSDGQRVAVHILLKSGGAHTDALKWFALTKLLGREITRIGDMNLDDWHALRMVAYPRWDKNDWTIGDEFKRLIADFVNEYRETVLGQLRLF